MEIDTEDWSVSTSLPGTRPVSGCFGRGAHPEIRYSANSRSAIAAPLKKN
jgi:hypothetical protein